MRGGVGITEEEGECTAFTPGPTPPQDWGLGAGAGWMGGMGLVWACVEHRHSAPHLQGGDLGSPMFPRPVTPCILCIKKGGPAGGRAEASGRTGRPRGEGEPGRGAARWGGVEISAGTAAIP